MGQIGVNQDDVDDTLEMYEKELNLPQNPASFSNTIKDKSPEN